MAQINRRDLARCSVGRARRRRRAWPARPRGRRSSRAADTTRFFPGFKPFKVQTTGAVINGVIGGQGPPVLLLHGAPQSHISWRLVAPKLAATHTVVVVRPARLRRQQQAAGRREHVNYSKRAMALDQVEVMRHFGFDEVPGDRPGPRRTRRAPHDARSPRQGHARRGARHHPDPLPLHARRHPLRAGVLPLVQLPAPGARAGERAEGANDAQLARATTDMQNEYVRAMSDPATIHAMCEDYRAGASIDLKHDAADLNKKIALSAARALGREGRDGPDLRRAGDLARARHEGHRPGASGRAQPAGRRAGDGGRGNPCLIKT